MDFKNINMNEDSLLKLLNFIVDLLNEDRKLALDQFEEFKIMSSINNPLLIKDVSESMIGFLNAASSSTDKAIRIAKLMSDILAKRDDSVVINDDDRDFIESLTSEISEARVDISKKRYDLENINESK